MFRLRSHSADNHSHVLNANQSPYSVVTSPVSPHLHSRGPAGTFQEVSPSLDSRIGGDKSPKSAFIEKIKKNLGIRKVTEPGEGPDKPIFRLSRNTVTNPPEEPSPAMLIAADENVFTPLTRDGWINFRKLYEKYRNCMNAPLLDIGFTSTLGIKDWPTTNATKNAPKSYFREKELLKKYRDIADSCRPNLAIFDMVKDLESNNLLSKERIMPILEACADALQLHGQELTKITWERRFNILQCANLPPQILAKAEDASLYGDWEELRENLFGDTFINNFYKFLDVSARVREQVQKNKSDNKRSFSAAFGSQEQPKQNRYVKNSIISTLIKMNLPTYDVPIKFKNIPDVNFIGGRLKYFQENWLIVTTEPEILETTKGLKIDFADLPKLTQNPPRKTKSFEPLVIEKLLVSGLIEKTKDVGLVSNIFFKQKSSGEYRMILDLSNMNKHVIYKKFKMQSVGDAIKLTQKDDFYAKVDLKSAYDTCPVDKDYQKYLQFQSEGTTYQYNGWPNGLAEAPYKFTKILKPIIRSLNYFGIRHVSYLDDMIVMNKSQQWLKMNISFVIQIFMYLGFVPNVEKSVVIPSQKMEFLGLVLNSREMSVSLPVSRIEKVKKLCTQLLGQKHCTIREIAKIVGLLVSTKLAVTPAPLHYRGLQRLIPHTQPVDWEEKVMLTPEAKMDLSWWINNIEKNKTSPMSPPSASLVLETDASGKGWGARMGNLPHAQDFWSCQERKSHINYLELKAIHLGLLTLAKNIKNKNIIIKSDSLVALSYLRKMGGTKIKPLSDLAIQIWEWALQRGIYLIVEHIPGRLNVVADYLSRIPEDRSDWKLNQEIFQSILTKWGPIHIDLFARPWNAQVKSFYTWRAHHLALGTDALIHQWPKMGGYAFPPYPLIHRILQKIYMEQCQIILIAPVFKGASWYSTLLNMSIAHPILLPPSQECLRDQEGNPHLFQHRIAAWRLSGNSSKGKEFLLRLQRSWAKNNETPLSNSMTQTGEDGLAGIIQKIPIHFQTTSTTSLVS